MKKTENPKIMPDVGLVIAASGQSRRFGAGKNKLLCLLDGLPVFCHCLRNFLPGLDPANIVLSVSAELEGEFHRALQAAGLPSEIRLVLGGASRQESVFRGLQALPASVEIVAVQDAARPHTTLELLRSCVESARERGSGVAAHKVTDTIKVADKKGLVRATPERATLWAAETPQVFRRELLERAYRRVFANGQEVTDDAQAVELLPAPVYLVPHQANNAKITYPADLNLE
jgi:2-C-methyl-D-erythritol 4-phosphate cytidylyltransferase